MDEEVVVANRNYYLGWKALLLRDMYYNDSGRTHYNIFSTNTELRIYPVNINQQALIVPKNSNLSLLRFSYDPLSYKIGGIISITSLAGWLFLMKKMQRNSVSSVVSEE